MRPCHTLYPAAYLSVPKESLVQTWNRVACLQVLNAHIVAGVVKWREALRVRLHPDASTEVSSATRGALVESWRARQPHATGTWCDLRPVASTHSHFDSQFLHRVAPLWQAEVRQACKPGDSD